jgi:glycosyltransferase involved in cell wall biosynthesis
MRHRVLDRLGGSKEATLVLDSLLFGCPRILRRLLSEPRISRRILLVHFLPSSNPLLSQRDRKAWEERERALLERMDGFCVPSRFLSERLVERGVPASRIVICSPGVDRKLLSIRRRLDSSAAGGGRSEAVRILSIANWNPAKGLIWLLEPLEELGSLSWEWHLVGDTRVDPGYARRFRAALAESPIGSRTKVHGVQDREAVRSHLQEADLFVLASLAESYGMVFAEALAAGVPTVGNRVGGVPEIVQHGRTGLLCTPLSRSDWKQSLKRLITSVETRKAMQKAAMVQGNRLPCWEETAAAFLKGVLTLSEKAARFRADRD